MKNILIGGAWPYANGSLHIGHIDALLPGDIIARYYLFKGHNVAYVSCSDCHGTPKSICAKQEGNTPQAYCFYCHKGLTACFIKGDCPDCGSITMADQCDNCGRVLEPEFLNDPFCLECNNKIIHQETKQLFLG